ncbi:uncharacterized protein BJ171DRAFT_624616 [Polychytrium aggregatum]|uniref:uncharacterized protein n=1 Tax=Polychytrium aggregatum TaxID=110093 RepID=UPI0022FF11E8|nr:uncharacterized protein BJ171DRAFT_624616 [Polychytrium aggregatum]KAI9188503.1 hypothetical protein BJ171DRAFT_624616 [Polychytrium aggregatum]
MPSNDLSYVAIVVVLILTLLFFASRMPSMEYLTPVPAAQTSSTIPRASLLSFALDTTLADINAFSNLANRSTLYVVDKGTNALVKLTSADQSMWVRRFTFPGTGLDSTTLPRYAFFLTTTGVDWPEKATLQLTANTNGVVSSSSIDIRQFPGVARLVIPPPTGRTADTTYLYSFAWQ